MLEIQRLDFVPVARLVASAADISDDALLELLAGLKRELAEDVANRRRHVSIVDLAEAGVPLNPGTRAAIERAWSHH